MKYRKKPVEIEAIQWYGKHFIGGVPDWISEAIDKHMPIGIGAEPTGGIMRLGDQIHISTLEGIMIAMPGDYIIKGVKGELYPCKPDIFEMAYEKV